MKNSYLEGCQINEISKLITFCLEFKMAVQIVFFEKTESSESENSKRK
jgi:hypothetical protein